LTWAVAAATAPPLSPLRGVQVKGSTYVKDLVAFLVVAFLVEDARWIGHARRIPTDEASGRTSEASPHSRPQSEICPNVHEMETSGLSPVAFLRQQGDGDRLRSLHVAILVLRCRARRSRRPFPQPQVSARRSRSPKRRPSSAAWPFFRIPTADQAPAQHPRALPRAVIR